MDRRFLLQASWAQALARLAPVAAASAAATATSAAAAGAPAQGPYDWRSVTFGGGGFVDGFVFHPREAGLLYARTDIGGLYRFDPAARRWLPLLDHLSKADSDLMGVLAVAVDPTDANRVYAACGTYTGDWARKAALLASADRGKTWTQHELPFKLGGNEPGRGSGERLQVDPLNPQVLYLGTSKDGLWRSSDRGASFRRVQFPGKHVSLVALDAAQARNASQPDGASTTVWAGSHDEPGLYVSHNGGESFTRDTGLPAMAPQRAAFGANGTLYVTLAAGEAGVVCNPGGARTGGVWKRDGSGRWTEITPVKPGTGNQGFGYSGLDTSPRAPGRLVVSTIERWSAGDDLFLSDDDGKTWTALGARSRHDASRHPWLADYTRGQDRMGHWIADVKLDPTQPGRAVYGTGYGLWMTAELGAGTVNWDFAVNNLEETAALDLKSPSGGATLLAAMGDVSGGAWDDLGKGPDAGLFRPNNETNRSVDVAELNPAVMARVCDSGSGGYVSTNGGVSWRPFGPSPRPARSEAGRIAVSAKGGFFVWAPDKQPALCSRDRGRSWQVCEGWPADRSVSLVPVADRHVEGVFYVYDRKQGTVLASSDGGVSFKTSVTGLPKLETWQTADLVSAPGALRDLWLALPDGLLHIPANDQPVKAIKGFTEAWLVTLGKGAPQAPYASVYVWGKAYVNGAVVDGLFRTDDAGTSYQRICDDAHRYGRLLSLAADPLEHGVVYLAPHGRGVVVGRPRSAT